MSGMTQEFITSVQLQSYFTNKITGAPLSGGYVEFFKDSDRSVGKDVYEKVQNGFDESGNPLYEYVTLGNVVQLSGVGTFMDNTNNDISVYYYPWDADGNLQLYYVAVFDNLGVPQLTREGWPVTFGTSNPGLAGSTTSENQISNPQFVDVNFDPAQVLTLSFTGNSTTTIEIAPNWNLVVEHIGTATVDVERQLTAGSSNFPTQSPYYLSITPGNNIASLKLVQTLPHNPGIWSATEEGENGYVAVNMVLGPQTQTTAIAYVPSEGDATTLLSESNASDEYVEYSATVELPPSNNPQTSDFGSVSIVISMSSINQTIISSIQVLSLDGDVEGVQYEQQSVNRQIDHLFNYYNPLLQFKPITSYLVGWNFPLNPAQFLGETVAATAIGANKSKYVWDQTIVFQSANSGVSVTRNGSGAIVLTSAPAAGTQMALVQYLSGFTVREMLNARISAMVRAHASASTIATVSLWYTTDANLPSAVVSNNSIVLTLGSTGKPATFNGTWTEVPRSNLGDAKFTIAAGATNFEMFDYSFNGWDVGHISGVGTATYFAIVVGTKLMPQNQTISIESISLVPGDIPTIPAPQTTNQVLFDCQKYYWSTFPAGVIPATAAGYPGALSHTLGAGLSGTDNPVAFTVQVLFPTSMHTTPVMIYYNPTNNNAKWYAQGPASPQDSGVAASLLNISPVGVGVYNPLAVSDVPGNNFYVHASADARLGY